MYSVIPKHPEEMEMPSKRSRRQNNSEIPLE